MFKGLFFSLLWPVLDISLVCISIMGLLGRLVLFSGLVPASTNQSKASVLHSPQQGSKHSFLKGRMMLVRFGGFFFYSCEDEILSDVKEEKASLHRPDSCHVFALSFVVSVRLSPGQGCSTIRTNR